MNQNSPNPRASHHDRYFTEKKKQNTKTELSTGLTHNDDADMKQKAEPVHGLGVALEGRRVVMARFADIL